jgi:hypothetical protein
MKTAATLILTTALLTSAPLWASDQDRIDAFVTTADEVASFIQATHPTLDACQYALDHDGADGLSSDACGAVLRLHPDVTAALQRFRQAIDRIELAGLGDDPQVEAASREARQILQANRLKVRHLGRTMSDLTDELQARAANR